MFYFQPMMYEDQGLIKDDPENLAVNSVPIPFDTDEIDELLVNSDENTPGHSTRIVTA